MDASRCLDCGAKRIDSQLGLEPTPEQYVENMVAVFREVRRVLRDDGTLWLNLGDSYAGGGGFAPNAPSNKRRRAEGSGMDGAFRFSDRVQDRQPAGKPPGLNAGCKPKDLVGIPWMVAFALRADGWYLRSDIIWAKPNPMPESVTDRPTKAHEYLFLLTKSPRYFYDDEAIKEAATFEGPNGAQQSPYAQGFGRRTPEQEQERRVKNRTVRLGIDTNGGGQGNGAMTYPAHSRNKRSVWTVATQPFSFQRGREHDKTYKASPDCPEHGPLADRERWQRAADGEPQAGRRYRIDSIDARRALARLDESDATNSPSNSDSRPTASARTSQSRAASKTPAPLTVSSPDECESPGSHTTRNRDGSESQRRSLDSLAPSGASTASGSSTESRRSAAQSERGGTACEELPDHTQYTGPSDVRLAPSGSDNPERSGKSVHTSRTCTCEESVLDHFATFPPKLIEPCILAGSPPKCCGECGAPWERVTEDDGLAAMARSSRPQQRRAAELAVEKGLTDAHLAAARSTGPADVGRAAATQNGVNAVGTQALALEAKEALAGYFREFTAPATTTVGWRSTCDHGPDHPVRSSEVIGASSSGDGRSCSPVVLDPFAGSGTTGVVALRHNRDFIGIELNETYAEMARRRIYDDAPLFNHESATLGALQPVRPEAALERVRKAWKAEECDRLEASADPRSSVPRSTENAPATQERPGAEPRGVSS